MFIPNEWLEAFQKFLTATGGSELTKSEYVHQPDFRGRWQGKEIWMYSCGDGYELCGEDPGELKKSWAETVKAATDEQSIVDKQDIDHQADGQSSEE